jgi:hypothetical protein
MRFVSIHAIAKPGLDEIASSGIYDEFFNGGF